MYLVSHPDDVQRVLQANWRNYRKGVFNRPLVPLLGAGLLTNESESWLVQRRLLQPAFHREHVSALAAIVAEEAEALVEHWRGRRDPAGPIEIGPAMHRLTFRIASRALLGVRTEMGEAVGRAFAAAIEHVNFRSRHPLAPPAWVPTRRNRRYRSAVAALDGLIRGIIRERKHHATEGRDILSLLLSARDAETGEGMSEQQLRDEALTFLVAGHETSANLLSWTWYLLAQHPAQVDRIRSESENFFPRSQALPEGGPQLRYTRQVIEESLRLFPPSVVLPRQANGPDTLSGCPVPEDAAILISQYVVHRHPLFWADPERFDPERFTAERTAARHRFAFIPFGGGPRVCIGREFALMEAQIILSVVSRAFRMSLVPGREVEPDVAVTLRPRNLWVHLSGS